MNITDLLNNLDKLSSWRKKELTSARFLAEAAKNEEEIRYLCRAWVLVMYAHCDNFLKESARYYLEYLKDNIELNNKYKQEIMWIFMRGKNLVDAEENKYKSMDECYKNSKDIFFDVTLIDQTTKIKSFNYKLLRYFCDWILQINFNHKDYITFCNTLKKKRDSIAHGEEAYIDSPNDCLQWHNITIQFMDSFKDSLIENAI